MLGVGCVVEGTEGTGWVVAGVFVVDEDRCTGRVVVVNDEGVGVGGGVVVVTDVVVVVFGVVVVVDG